MNKFLMIVGLSFLTLFSCATPYNLKSDQVVMYIASETVDCVGVAPLKCMKVKESNDSEWTYFYSNINGFTYEPGFEYKLIVQKSEVEKPIPADASSIRYTLVKELKKTKK